MVMTRAPLASIQIDGNTCSKAHPCHDDDGLKAVLKEQDDEVCLRAAIAAGKAVTAMAFGDAIESYVELKMPDKAYNVLQLQWQHYFQTGNEQAKPNALSYTIVMNACKDIGGTTGLEAAGRCEDILKQMEVHQHFGVDCKPSLELYKLCMKTWAQDAKHAGKLVDLFRRVKNIHSVGEATLRPDVECYSIIIPVLVKSSIWQYASSLLFEMVQYCGCLSTDLVREVLNRYRIEARVDKSAAGVSEAILRHCHGLCNEDEDLKLSRKCYEHVVRAYYESCSCNCSQRGLDFLRWMLAQEDNDAHPSPKMYFWVIDILVRDKFVHQADDLLRQMSVDLKEEPPLCNFQRVLAGWSRQPNRAQSLLDFMVSLRFDIHQSLHEMLLSYWVAAKDARQAEVCLEEMENPPLGAIYKVMDMWKTSALPQASKRRRALRTQYKHLLPR